MSYETKPLIVTLWVRGSVDARFFINPASDFTYRFPPDAKFDMLTIAPIPEPPVSETSPYGDWE